MIQTEINVARTFIQVHPHKVYGSHPTVVALRAKYELKK